MIAHNASRYLSPYTREETIVLSVTLGFIMLLSFIGNWIIVMTLYKNNKMWISTNILIGNLSLGSLGVTVLVMPFSLFSAAFREWIFREGVICNLTGFSASLLLLVTIFTHTALSLDKYYGVVKPLSRAFTTKRTWIMVAVIWTVSSFMSLGPLVGIARFEYNPTTLICGVGFPRSSRETIYLGLLAVLGYIVPLTVMIFVYIRVYIALRQQARRLLDHAIVTHEVLNLQKRLILTVFFSLLCFIACWAPFFFLATLAVVIKKSSQLPHALGVAAYWTGYGNSVLYPAIICSMSNRFREGFLDIFTGARKIPLVIIHMCRKRNIQETKKAANQKGSFHSLENGINKQQSAIPLSAATLSSTM